MFGTVWLFSKPSAAPRINKPLPLSLSFPFINSTLPEAIQLELNPTPHLTNPQGQAAGQEGAHPFRLCNAFVHASSAPPAVMGAPAADAHAVQRLPDGTPCQQVGTGVPVCVHICAGLCVHC